MKRKALIIIIAIIIAAMIAGLCVELYKGLCVTEFSAADYEDEILEFTDSSIEIKTEPINSRAAAARAADSLWSEYYRKPKGYYQKQVSYDEENDCWMVQGLIWKAYFMKHNPNVGFSGGSAFAVISSNGEVLAVWREY